MKPEPRDDLFLLGVGNTIREDDGIGIYVLRRLREYYSPRLHCLEITEPDISLACEIASYKHLIIIDALAEPVSEPYVLSSLEPVSPSIPGGFTSHLFSWGEILYTAGEVYGQAPKTQLLGISAYDFGIGETISPSCKKNGEAAFDYLVGHHVGIRRVHPLRGGR